MAWLDNRAWCHPKILACSVQARWVFVSGICYSAGFVTNGRLNPEQQRMIGSTPKLRRELENAGLWLDDGPDIVIHDWDEHNGDRDRKAERRKRLDRERQARLRASRHADGHADNLRDIACLTVEGVTGEEVTTKEADLIDLHDRMSSIGKAI